MDLRLGDCLEGLAGLADRSVDHVICDPPYDEHTHTNQRGQKKQWGVLDCSSLDFAALGEGTRSLAAAQFSRIARRWVIAFCEMEGIGAWKAALVAAGLEYIRAGIWVKIGAAPQFTGDRPAQACEAIVIAHQPGKKRWNGAGRHALWTATIASKVEAVEHSTQKPQSLMESLVSDFTDPGELVCDPFAGSGTTAVACKRLGRRFIGWERDPVFHAAAVKRIEAAREQFQLLRLPKAKQAKLL